jgi:hypothetical protein
MAACRHSLLLIASLLFGAAACGESRRPALKAKAAPAKHKDEKAPARPAKEAADEPDITDLHHEVEALSALYDLEVTPAQLKALEALAKRTAERPGPRQVIEVSEKYRKALRGLRQALLDNDRDGIEELDDELENLREEEEAPNFEAIAITDAARKEAPALLKQLSTRQVVRYVAGVKDFPDPGEKLLDALAQARELEGKEWRELRDAVAEEVGGLVAGLDAEREERVRGRALALLNKAQRLTEKEHAKQQAALEKEARDLAGKVGPIDVVRHYMERSLAELLSNPQLGKALAARRKASVSGKRARPVRSAGP